MNIVLSRLFAAAFLKAECPKHRHVHAIHLVHFYYMYSLCFDQSLTKHIYQKSILIIILIATLSNKMEDQDHQHNRVLLHPNSSTYYTVYGQIASVLIRSYSYGKQSKIIKIACQCFHKNMYFFFLGCLTLFLRFPSEIGCRINE